MMKLRSSRLTVAVLAAAAVILIAGGVATASNMGFKLNKMLKVGGVVGSPQIGKNWTSLPFNNPYPTIAALCSQTGLPIGSLTGAKMTLLSVNGLFPVAICGEATAGTIAIPAGKGVQIEEPTSASALSSIIIVGSHNPTMSITILKASSGQQGKYWFSVPYHTTATTVRDLCIQAGLSTVGITAASITRLNATTGLFSAPVCGTGTASTTPLVLGEFVEIRAPGGPNTFIPAHF